MELTNDLIDVLIFLAYVLGPILIAATIVGFLELLRIQKVIQAKKSFEKDRPALSGKPHRINPVRLHQ